MEEEPFNEKSGPVVITMSEPFEEAERDAIRHFKERVLELQDTAIGAGGRRIHCQIRAKRGERPEFDVDLAASEDEIRSFLLSFRLLYMNDEPCNFNRVCNMINRRAKHPVVDGNISFLKGLWADTLEKPVIITINGQEISSRRLMDLWINGRYFHAGEKEKRRELDEMLETVGEQYGKFLMLDAAYQGTKAVALLYRMIQTLQI